MNSGESACSQTGHVLADDPGGTDVVDDVDHGGPEPAGVLLRHFAARVADWLTRETPCNDIDSWSGFGSPPLDAGSDVVMLGDSGPVSGEHGTAERVDLDLAHHVEPGALQTEGHAADTGEQLQDGRAAHGPLSSTGGTQ